MQRLLRICIACVCALSLASCFHLDTRDFHLDSRDLLPVGDGVQRVSNWNFDSIANAAGHGVGTGVSQSLLDTATAHHIDALVKKLATTAMVALQDSLLNPSTRNRLTATINALLDTLNSPHNRNNIHEILSRISVELSAMVHSLLGPETGEQVQALINKYVLGDSTMKRIDLLGERLTKMVVGIVDTLGYGINHKIVMPTEQGITKLSTWLLYTGGGVVIVVMLVSVYLFILKRRYLQLTELMTTEIHRIPDRASYDELVHRIHTKAVDRKLEPELRNILKDHGILGKESWLPAPPNPNPPTPTQLTPVQTTVVQKT
ncbi:MAG: hypothetical protein ABI444_12020 [Candidatus Kapaibacterium sp.]|jgi:hypothetical protein